MFDAGLLTKKAVGRLDFSLASIYNASNTHSDVNHWHALFDPDVSNRGLGVQGYIRLTLAVIGPNDSWEADMFTKKASEGSGDNVCRMFGVKCESERNLHRFRCRRLSNKHGNEYHSMCIVRKV